MPCAGAGSKFPSSGCSDVSDTEVKQFDGCFIGWKMAPGFGDSPQLVVDRFDLVGGEGTARLRGRDDLADPGGDFQDGVNSSHAFSQAITTPGAVMPYLVLKSLNARFAASSVAAV